MTYGNPDTNFAVSRSMDSVQDILERDRCICGDLRRDHANGQGIQPQWIATPCKKCNCPRFQWEKEGQP